MPAFRRFPASRATAWSTMLDGVAKHGARKADEWDRIQTSTRLAAAKLVNAEARQIAFVRNTSEALSIVANGVDWKLGDNVVSTAVEFPGERLSLGEDLSGTRRAIAAATGN